MIFCSKNCVKCLFREPHVVDFTKYVSVWRPLTVPPVRVQTPEVSVQKVKDIVRRREDGGISSHHTTFDPSSQSGLVGPEIWRPISQT